MSQKIIIPKLIKGMTERQWSVILQLVHKAQTRRDDIKRGRKRGGMDGMMDKIIRESAIWERLDIIEDKVRDVCFEFDERTIAHKKHIRELQKE